jgi:YbbR domain-containing protein
MLKLITNNLGYKLFSLALAAALWMILVEEDRQLTASFSVPVQYRNIPKDLEMTSDVSDRVHLDVRGPAGKLTPDHLNGTVVLLDLKPVTRQGEQTFPIGRAEVQLPTGVELDRAIPSQIRLTFERQLKREVPVTIRIGSPPPAGIVVISKKVEPATVWILGPDSRVREVSAVETDPLDLSDIKDSEDFPVHTYLSDPRVRVEGGGRVVVRVEVKPSGTGGN